MNAGIPLLIVALVVVVVIIAFFAWLIFGNPVVAPIPPLPPFNPIPPTTVELAGVGSVLKSVGPQFTNTIITDIYPDPDPEIERSGPQLRQNGLQNRENGVIIHVDLEVVEIGDVLSSVECTFDLKLSDDGKNIVTSFDFKGSLRPKEIYYLTTSPDSTVTKNIIKPTDGKGLIRAGHTYIASLTVSIAADQPNISADLENLEHIYDTLQGTKATGKGAIAGSSISPPEDEGSTVRTSENIRERLLSVFRNSSPTLRQDYRLIIIELKNVIPLDVDVSTIETLNTTGKIVTSIGETIMFASSCL